MASSRTIPHSWPTMPTRRNSARNAPARNAPARRALARTAPGRLALAGVAAVLALVSVEPALAQEQTPGERPFGFIIQVGAGGALSRGPDQTVPADAEESRFGLALSARALWRPGHLLGIGVQSGFTRVSTLESSAGNAIHLSTVPAMLVFAMESSGFDASAAAGWQRYIVGTEGRNISSAWEMSYALSAAYTLYTTDALALALEGTYTSIPERTTTLASLQLRLQYTLHY